MSSSCWTTKMKLFVCVVFAILSLTQSSPLDLDGRIIGGEDATDGQFPYQVSLQVDNQHNCGGAILNQYWILTAAHCVAPYSANILSILTGTTTLSSGGTRYPISNAFIHGDWDPTVKTGDIALVRTLSAMALGALVQPIPLYTSSVPPGSDTVLSGWGYTRYPDLQESDRMKYVGLKSISVEECRDGMRPDPIYDTELCTQNAAGQGACFGDSGGPLVYNGQLIGVVSWGKPCALGKPDVFTKVTSYLKWIHDVIVENP